MIKLTMPDGSIREVASGITAYEVAKSISHGLAKKVLSAEINGEVWDLTRPITNDSSFKLLTWDDDGGASTFWHSSAHLLAEALENLYPGVKFGIGPSIDNGFYYDVDLGDYQLSPEDLPKIEKEMLSLASQKNTYERKEVSKKEALAYFEEKGTNSKFSPYTQHSGK